MDSHGGGQPSRTPERGSLYRRRGTPSRGTPSRLMGRSSRRRQDDAGMPSVLPYFLLGGAVICAMAMPFYILFMDGMPDFQHTQFKPPTDHFPTKAVHPKPVAGLHFVEGVLHGEGRTLGEKGAPNYLVEFTDFFCPHCQEAHEITMTPVLAHYVQSGELRVESHPVAFLDDDSLRAAHAALCAQEQHKYWEVRELLFQVDVSKEYYGEGDEEEEGGEGVVATLREGEGPASGDRQGAGTGAAAGAGGGDGGGGEGGGARGAYGEGGEDGGTTFTAALLKRIAFLAGLDLSSFVECFRSGRHVEEVQRISQTARDMGVYGTPYFIIDGKRHEGVLSVHDLEMVLGHMLPEDTHPHVKAKLDAEERRREEIYRRGLERHTIPEHHREHVETLHTQRHYSVHRAHAHWDHSSAPPAADSRPQKT